jgi:hypothetical protein
MSVALPAAAFIATVPPPDGTGPEWTDRRQGGVSNPARWQSGAVALAVPDCHCSDRSHGTELTQLRLFTQLQPEPRLSTHRLLGRLCRAAGTDRRRTVPTEDPDSSTVLYSSTVGHDSSTVTAQWP